MAPAADAVAAGLPPHEAHALLAALGFEHGPGVDSLPGGGVPRDGLVFHAWTHPAGVLVLGTAPAPPFVGALFELRALMALDLGWRAAPEAPAPTAAGVPAPAKLVDRPDGTRVWFHRPLLDGATGASLGQVMRAVADLPLLPFEAWGGVPGGNATWLPGLVPLGVTELRAFERAGVLQARLAQFPDALRSALCRHADGTGLGDGHDGQSFLGSQPLAAYLRASAQAAGADGPTNDEAAALARWERDAHEHRPPGGVLMEPTRLRTGIQQPTVWAFHASDALAQQRMLTWLRTAPKAAVRNALLTPNALGDGLLTLVLARAVRILAGKSVALPADSSRPTPRPALDHFQAVVDTARRRVGPETVAKALGLGGSVAGRVLAALDGLPAERRNAEGLVLPSLFPERILKLADGLEAQGIPWGPGTAVAGRLDGDAGTVDRVLGNLASLAPDTDWAPLRARLRSASLQGTLAVGDGAAATRRPRL